MSSRNTDIRNLSAYKGLAIEYNRDRRHVECKRLLGADVMVNTLEHLINRANCPCYAPNRIRRVAMLSVFETVGLLTFSSSSRPTLFYCEFSLFRPRFSFLLSVSAFSF